MTVNGQDWAGYQPATPSTSGLDFVFIKVTEGTGYTNPKWQQQRDHARRDGLVVGYYHYAHGLKNLAEADFFLSKVTLAPGEMLAFDWEDSEVSDAEKDAWIKYVQGKVPAHRVVLYCNRNYWLTRDHAGFVGDGLWIADPDAPAGHPRVTHAWTFHQHSSAGGVDRNVGNFASKAALQTWAAKGAVPKPPPPKPVPKPHVDLSNLIAAATRDPKATQGHTTHPGDVRLVEAALKAEGLLPAKYAGDGSFGSKTVDAYAAWQRHLGYKGSDANGIPGKTSLTKLGARHGFTVVA